LICIEGIVAIISLVENLFLKSTNNSFLEICFFLLFYQNFFIIETVQ